MSKAYYNENDPKAAAWLRELIKVGAIASGTVDERSIEDVTPNDLRDFTQHHFFAGIGGWSYALRLAGWPDDRAVWTGSCPCQPFSAAGKGGGVTDERHLWPALHHLIRLCRPSVVFGEQVASKDGLGWLDTVQADLEGAGYACGAFDLCAAGVGAPHIRQRLYFVAHDNRSGRQARRQAGAALGHGEAVAADSCAICVADSSSQQPHRDRDARRRRGEPADGSVMGHAHGTGSQARAEHRDGADEWLAGPSRVGHWANAEFIPCTDGKARPIEPGTFPLAHGIPHRVGLLRGYGNAIVPQVAAQFVSAYLDCSTATKKAKP